MNRTFPGKAESGTFVLDFYNEPEDILESFQPYYQTAELAVESFVEAKDMFERTQKTGDPVLMANAENSLKECKKAKDELEIFKWTWVPLCVFMSFCRKLFKC